MAVTNLIQPSSHMPAYNPQWFKSSSTQTAQPNFVYRVILTDVISGASTPRNIDPDPSGRCVFDASSFARQYITQANPSGLYGFQLNTGAIRTIRVNVGEMYDVAGTPTYFAGANFDYIVWNGSIDTLSNDVRDMQNYAYTDYVYTQGNNIQLITNNRNPSYTWATSSTQVFYSNPETVIANRSSYIYCLGTATGDLEKIRVIGYDSSGAQVGSSVILNTYNASASYLNRYVFIDVGYDGLANMPSAQIISGNNPIPVSTYAYWEVYDESTWLPQPGGPGQPYIYPLKRFNMICEPRFSIIELHYLSPQGSFESQVCAKLSVRTHDTTKSYYSKLPYSTSGTGAITYTYGSSVENTLSSNVKSKLTINTDWLEEYEVTQLRDAISAPIIYVDQGNARGHLSMKMVTNSFQEKKKYNDKLISVQFDLEYTTINVRQSG